MIQKPERSIMQIVKQSARFQKIMAQCEHITLLNEFLKPVLAKYGDCCIANFADGILTILAVNASAATRLRFHAHEILKEANTMSQVGRIEKIKVKVK